MPFIKQIKYYLLISFGLAFFSPTAWADAKFNLQWEYKDVPIQFELYETSQTLVAKTGTTEEVDSLSKLTIFRALKDHSLTLKPHETRVMYLVAHNKTNKEVRFAVAPHSTHPTEYSIGFKFNCLCNGHIYKISPGKIWTRIIFLRSNAGLEDAEINLKHIVFKAK